VVEVDRLRLHEGAILHRLGHFARKGGDGRDATVRTLFNLSPVFGDFNLHRRQVKHLSLFVSPGFNRCQRTRTILADLHPMNLDMLGIRHRFEGVSRMSRLPPTGFATGLAQTVAARFLLPIAGRGLAAVVAILEQLIPQLLLTASNCWMRATSLSTKAMTAASPSW